MNFVVSQNSESFITARGNKHDFVRSEPGKLFFCTFSDTSTSLTKQIIVHNPYARPDLCHHCVCRWSRPLEGTVLSTKTENIFFFNSTGQWLVPNDAIWQYRTWWRIKMDDKKKIYRTWSTMVQVMAWCLTAPSHHLNQWWLIISQVLWYITECSLTGNAQDINH